MDANAAIYDYIRQHRDDISNSLVHWTKKGHNDDMSVLNPFERLRRIIGDGTLRAYCFEGIKVQRPVVCFSETPLRVMSYLFRAAKYDRQSCSFQDTVIGNFLRYAPYGLLFRKSTIYHRFSGRPVFYLSDQEMHEFFPRHLIDPAKVLWRVVRYEPHYSPYSIDWSHEREWRTPNPVAFATLPPNFKPLAVVAVAEEKERLERDFPPSADGPIRGVVALYDT